MPRRRSKYGSEGPRTASGAFIRYNDFEEVAHQKYKDVDHVRHEYANLVHSGFTHVEVLPLTEHPFYRQKLGVATGEFSNAEDIGRRTFSIPLSAALDDQDVEDVITAVRRIALTNVAF